MVASGTDDSGERFKLQRCVVTPGDTAQKAGNGFVGT